MPAPQLTPLFYPESTIDAALHDRLITLLSTCFQGPNDAPFRVQSYWRKPPTWRWIAFADETPVAQLTAHDCPVGTPVGVLRVAAIGDVCTHPDYRGHGLARRLLSAAHDFLRQEGFPFAFLTGKPEIYRGSGYQPIANPIRRYEPGDGQWVTAPVDHAMVRPLGAQVWPAGTVDFNDVLI